MNRIIGRRRNRTFLVVLGCLLIMTLTLDGCAPLRKKFTRKKKKDRKEPQEVPILEPIDYPEKVYSPLNTYKHHYSLWQVWHKELISDLSIGASSKKRLRHHLNQAIVNLEEIKGLLVEEKQALLIASLKHLYRFRNDLEAALPSMSLSSWEIKLRSIERKIRSAYSVKKIEEFIKQ